MQFQKIVLTLGIVFLFSCSTGKKSGSGIGNDWEVIPFEGQLQVLRTKLDNGLKLLVVEDSSSPTFSYQTWFNVGSKHEEQGKTGLAHFFEHMMFRGTKNHPDGEFDRLSEGAGAEGMNAFTSNDYTAYIQRFPKKSFDLIVDLESDRMVNLIVEDKVFNTERGAVLNERRMRIENSPEGMMWDTLYGTVFSESPYHWPVIGYEADLHALTAKDGQDFYKKFYSPDRAAIVVVGDVDADTVYKKIQKAYGSIPAAGAKNSEFKTDPEQTAQKRKKLALNLENEKLFMAFRMGAITDTDTPVLDIVQSVLSDTRSSRFKKALVDAGICSKVYSGSEGLAEPGIYLVTCDLQVGKKASFAEAIILAELQRLARTPISEIELARAKTNYRFVTLGRLNSAYEISKFLGLGETILGDFRKLHQIQKAAANVTAEQIRDVSAKVFNTKKMTVIVGVPK